MQLDHFEFAGAAKKARGDKHTEVYGYTWLSRSESAPEWDSSYFLREREITGRGTDC